MSGDLAGGRPGLGDARGDADAAVAGAGDEEPVGQRGDDSGMPLAVVRAVLREAAGPAGHAHRRRLQVEPEVPADLGDGAIDELSSSRSSTTSPSRPSETRSTSPRSGRQWAHFCEPNDAAVTVRCTGLGTR